MSSKRQPLQENPPADAATDTSTLPMTTTKKLKTAEPSKVLTFSVSHSPVQVQLLDIHTLFHLVDILCQTTTVGEDESVYDHMWDVYVPGFSGSFNSSADYVNSAFASDNDGPLRVASRVKLRDLHLTEGTTMTLKYDYGSTSVYKITLVGIDEVSEVDTDEFPREKPAQLPTGFQEFSTDSADLNAMFPTFNTFLQEAEMLCVNLFQPGRKKNYGYVERGNQGVKHMIFLPAPPKSDLSDYLHTFNYASRFKYSTFDSYGSPNYNWFSVVIFPNGYNKSVGKYGEGLEPGFCDMAIASPNPQPSLNAVFPKVAALAGYKKDKKVSKGWITYKNSILRMQIAVASPRAGPVLGSAVARR